MKYVIAGMFVAILGSLLAAYLALFTKNSHNPKKMVKALTLRISISMLLFFMLILSFYYSP